MWYFTRYFAQLWSICIFGIELSVDFAEFVSVCIRFVSSVPMSPPSWCYVVLSCRASILLHLSNLICTHFAALLVLCGTNLQKSYFVAFVCGHLFDLSICVNCPPCSISPKMVSSGYGGGYTNERPHVVGGWLAYECQSDHRILQPYTRTKVPLRGARASLVL